MAHGGYRRLDPAAFDRGAALWPEEVLPFVQATQPQAWARLTELYKGEAPEMLLKELARALETRGTLDVLRHGLRIAGTTLHLAFFRPASGAVLRAKRSALITAAVTGQHNVSNWTPPRGRRPRMTPAATSPAPSLAPRFGFKAARVRPHGSRPPDVSW